jgi:6-phosphogluconolactonase
VSSYALDDDGTPSVVSASVPTTETAACWIVVSKNGKFVYTTNTGSGTVSGYKFAPSTGALTLLHANGVTADTGAGSAPTDLALSINGKYLYVLNSGTHEIDVFKVHNNNGSLSVVQSIDGLPDGATGLAAR